MLNNAGNATFDRLLKSVELDGGDFHGSRSYLPNYYNHKQHAKTGSNSFRCRCYVAHPYFLAKRTKPKKDKQTKNI